MRLAARGTREGDQREERVLERAERLALRRQARRVMVRVSLLTLGGVALALLGRLVVQRLPYPR